MITRTDDSAKRRRGRSRLGFGPFRRRQQVERLSGGVVVDIVPLNELDELPLILEGPLVSELQRVESGQEGGRIQNHPRSVS
jgi:hypothetical protein